MKRRSSVSSRRATIGGTDGRSLEAALVASSLLLWLPYSLAAIYVAYCRSLITEIPLAFAGAASMNNASGGQVFRSPSAAAASSTSFGSSEMSAMTMNSVMSGSSSAAAALTGHLHRYSAFYYYIFPAGFDIAVFLPLLLRVLSFSAVAVAVTVYFAVYHLNAGEYLMVVAWALGTCSDYGWLTSPTGSVQPTGTSGGSAQSFLVSATPSSWLWLVVSLLTGLFSGILCKVKDIVDGKHDRNTHLFRIFDRAHSAHSRGCGDGSGSCGALSSPSSPANRQGESAHGMLSDEGRQISSAMRRRQRVARDLNSQHLVSLGDRLYMVVPFCTGQWFAFILNHGWWGIVVENGTILLSLSLVGYTMLSFKFLKRQVLRASGRVTRSVAARGRTRRNQRRLRQLQEQQQQKQQQGTPLGPSSEDFNAHTTPTAEGELCGGALLESNGSVDSSSPAVSPGATAALLSDDDAEEEITDFFEDVGEVAFIDVIDLISKLFTTSFGVVVLCVIGLNIFMTSLCIPFLKALFKLNALVSGVGIVIELIMYEVA